MNSVIGVLFLVSAVVGQGTIDSATLQMFDKNSDGILERSEIPGMDQMPDAQWAQMENLVDKNHDGKITIQEYIDFNNEQQAAHGDPSKQMEQGLKALDLNNDGNLDRNELPGDMIPDEAWKAMLTEGDTDNNGKISIEEYKAVIEMSQQDRGADDAGRGHRESFAVGANGAASLTVATVLLELIATMCLFW